MKNLSWKTSLFGIIAGTGLAITQLNSCPHWLYLTGQIMSAAGTAATGFFARDNNKTSADVGAVTKQ